MLKTPKNILLILTDQQSAKMMSCDGNKYLSTPAIDSLAERGTRCDLAFAANPVCVPSRFSMFTGLYPSVIGQRSNPYHGKLPDSIAENGLGYLIRKGGYEVAYAGKQHLPGCEAEDLGFNVISRDERDELAETCASFIKQRHENPFFLTCSFINPHDVCYMAISENASSEHDKRLLNRGGKEMKVLQESLDSAKQWSEEEFWAEQCPPLPANHAVQQNEPELIETGLLDQRAFRKKAREEWGEKQWRMHRWAYHRLTERVDRQIQIVLDAVKEAGIADNTIIIFTSDHGDHDASHKLEHKTALYEEAARVPLIIVDPDQEKTVDKTHLCSGIDIVPTICDYAGVQPPERRPGTSLKPLVGGKYSGDWRDSILIECEIGAAIRTPDLLYAKYDSGADKEQLYDMKRDCGQTRNFASLSEYQPDLHNMRLMMETWCPQGVCRNEINESIFFQKVTGLQ